MRCDQVQQLMDRYVNEGLPPDEREAFETHVRACPECQDQLAHLQHLVATLQSVPSPPVPQGFADRIMARAQRETKVRRVETPTMLRGRGGHGRMARLAKAMAATAAGLLLGVLLGQQTWRCTVSEHGARQPNASMDAETVYSLDYLSGTPRGSFTESYLSLTGMANDQEF